MNPIYQHLAEYKGDDLSEITPEEMQEVASKEFVTDWCFYKFGFTMCVSRAFKRRILRNRDQRLLKALKSAKVELESRICFIESDLVTFINKMKKAGEKIENRLLRSNREFDENNVLDSLLM